ncbi:MAG: 50S ribosomal protein L21e [Euryarchaeota archaeon]|nr:50S ribosomal protein L21e [Euryarchaeota archaeon]
MVKASKGFRVRTRHTLRVRPRDKGLPQVSASLREFKVGDRATVVLDGRVQGGMPHPRYHGKTGKVTGVQGRALMVEIVEGRKPKILLVTPEHLKRS